MFHLVNRDKFLQRYKLSFIKIKASYVQNVAARHRGVMKDRGGDADKHPKGIIPSPK